MSCSVSALEAVSLRAWPAGEESRQGGWLLRATGGYTRRANSVQPQGAPDGPLPVAIGRAEAWYRERGLLTIFKLTAESLPAGLDAALAAAGYVIEVPTLVMTRALAPADADVPPLPSGLRLSLAAAVDPAWVESYARWHDLPVASTGWHRMIVDRIGPPHAAARVHDRTGRLVAIGLAVADGPWVGLFDLVTAPELCGRGIGRALVGRLLAWGAAEGAKTAYLQVEEQNERARGVYGHLGFATAYPYRYRVASPLPPPHPG